MSSSSNVTPQHTKLQFKYKLPQKFPTEEIRRLAKGNYKEEDIISSNHAMRQFLLEKKVSKSNYLDVLSFLLQMEDHHIMSKYEKINLKNMSIQYLGSENYSFMLHSSQRNNKGKFKECDDIVVFNLNDTDDYYDEDVFENNYISNKPIKYYGSIDKIAGNSVYFSLRGKLKIPIERKFNIKIYPYRIPFRYQYEAVRKIMSSHHILKVLFPTENSNENLSNISIKFFNEAVEHNPEQAQAVRNIVNGSNNSMPFILFGPPGTGKLTTIIESVLQLWKSKPSSKILVTSGNNKDCSEIAKKIRKIFEEIDDEGCNFLHIGGESSEKKMDNTEEVLIETSNSTHECHSYPSLELIYRFRIIIATLNTCGKLVQAQISENHFTHIIIDECATLTETEALVGIAGLMGPNTKLILSGDPKQLGPFVKCVPAKNFGLDVSLMERLLNFQCYAIDPKTNQYDRSIQIILKRNFRSNNEILSISNDLCYNSQLLACAKPELTDWVHGWKNLPSKYCPIIFHSVYGQTEKEAGGDSSMNSEEIEVVLNYVRDILENGINGRNVEQQEIGIISPYKIQNSEILKQLDKNGWKKIKTGSVETFQGQEKPIIIISTVKSNTRNIGFLNNLKRVNVMLTRAQALLIIVGNPKSLQNDANWLQVLKYFQKKKAFTGKFFRLPINSTSLDVNLLPDVPKTGNNSKNNRTQFKPRNPHHMVNESKKTASHDNKKEFAFAQNPFSGSTSIIALGGEHRTNPLPTLTAQPSPSAPSYESYASEYRDGNVSLLYREPPPTYESLSRELQEMRLGNQKNRKPKKNDDCVIL